MIPHPILFQPGMEGKFVPHEAIEEGKMAEQLLLFPPSIEEEQLIPPQAETLSGQSAEERR